MKYTTGNTNTTNTNTTNTKKKKEIFTKVKLYYVFLPKFNVYKIGCTSQSLKSRMFSVAAAGITITSNNITSEEKVLHNTPVEGEDYIVLFLREYKYATAYKYESAIKRHNKDVKVPNDCKPLKNGNTELFWMDISHTFIDSIPASDC